MWRKLLIGSVVVFFVALAYSIMTYAVQERPPNWFYGFNEYGTEPFSTRIFFKQLPDFFPEKEVEKVRQENFYSLFWSNPELNDLYGDSLLNFTVEESNSVEPYPTSDFNYISVCNNFQSNYYGTTGLISHVFSGGHVQLHAFDFNYPLLERLGVKIEFIPRNSDTVPNLTTQTVIHRKTDTFELRNTGNDTYFREYTSHFDTLLINDSGQVQGIRAKLGHGSISLYCVPQLFTNYDLLNVDRELAESILSELPVEDTYWSTNLNQYEGEDKKGLLYFIFSYSTLKWAYFILLFSLLFYFVLNLQRKQRAIPVLESPKNLSLSFLQTMSDLHYARLDYHSILRKKMNYLRNQIKVEYHLHQNEVDDWYMDQLVKRSKIKKESIQRLFKFYNETIQRKNITKAEFESLCNLFQLFKK